MVHLSIYYICCWIDPSSDLRWVLVISVVQRLLILFHWFVSQPDLFALICFITISYFSFILLHLWMALLLNFIAFACPLWFNLNFDSHMISRYESNFVLTSMLYTIRISYSEVFCYFGSTNVIAELKAFMSF